MQALITPPIKFQFCYSKESFWIIRYTVNDQLGKVDSAGAFGLPKW